MTQRKGKPALRAGAAPLDRAGLLAAAGPAVETVALPGGETVRLRQLTAGDLIGLPDGERHSAALLARALVDADGNRLFGDDELDAVLALRGEVFRALVTRVLEANFATRAGTEALAKN